MIGQIVSHYRVLRRLGGGGMGEVYEAEDLKLGRRVALKFLTPTRTDAGSAIRRFEREAHTASALNHPHICTIHDFGEYEGKAFLVMELLEGETLRALLAKGRLELARVIEIGIQVADALESAHRARVIHRDITPSNIFITSRGDAKILDFGLAKMMPHHQAPAAPETEGQTVTADDVITSPGAAVGTVAYMSPEQATGEELDYRTDLFSFGAVLYEMATGRRPFAGRTSALVFDAILHRMPPPPAVANPALPPEFSQIIDKALEKDRKLRYQSAGDMKVDLERLRRREESAKLGVPERAGPIGRPRRRGGVPRRAIALGLIGAAAIGVALFLLLREPGIPRFKEEPITSASGWQAEPAIAPDGRVIAYVSNERGETPNLFLIATSGTPAPQPLVVGAGPKHHPTWFPDGERLAFVWEKVAGQPSIYVVPRSGGEPQPLVDDGEDPAISQDGRKIAFVRKDASGDRRVFAAPIADVSREEMLTTGKGDGAWDHHDPAWSPDGTEICYRAHRGLWIVRAEAGSHARLVTDERARDSNPFWSHDGRFLYFTSRREGATALWRVPARGGELRRLTRSTEPEQQGSLSGDGLVLAFSTLLLNPDLIIVDLATRAVVMMLNNERQDMCPVFGSNRVYFVSNRYGNNDVWMWPLEPSTQANGARPLTDQRTNLSHPSVSPDGKWVAYYRADEQNKRDIWIVAASGGQPTKYTTHSADDYHPAFSPDGRRIAFASNRTGGLHIWVGEVSGGRAVGEPRPLTFGSSMDRDQAPAWSPDGTKIAYITQASGAERDWEVRIANADGQGTPERLPATRGARRVRWPESRKLFVSGQFNEQMVTLRVFDPATREALPFARLELGENDDLVDFDVSPDGTQLVFSRDQPRRGNIWVYRAQRPF